MWKLLIVWRGRPARVSNLFTPPDNHRHCADPYNGSRIPRQHIAGVMYSEINPRQTDKPDQTYRPNPHHPTSFSVPLRIRPYPGHHPVKTECKQCMPAGKCVGRRHSKVKESIRPDTMKTPFQNYIQNQPARNGHSQHNRFITLASDKKK